MVRNVVELLLLEVLLLLLLLLLLLTVVLVGADPMSLIFESRFAFSLSLFSILLSALERK